MSQSNVLVRTNLLVQKHADFLRAVGFSQTEIDNMAIQVKLEPSSLGKSKINGEKIQRVVEPFAVDFNYKGETYLLIIDKDILTNLATVPRIFHLVINPDNKYVKQQAVAHDALVNEYPPINGVGHGRLFNGYLLINETKSISTQTVDPEFADIIFRELIEEGVRDNMRLKSWKAKAKAGICYAAITAWRLFIPIIRTFK